MTAAAAWLAALLLAVPVPARERSCILARRETIAASADAATILQKVTGQAGGEERVVRQWAHGGSGC